MLGWLLGRANRRAYNMTILHSCTHDGSHRNYICLTYVHSDRWFPVSYSGTTTLCSYGSITINEAPTPSFGETVRHQTFGLSFEDMTRPFFYWWLVLCFLFFLWCYRYRKSEEKVELGTTTTATTTTAILTLAPNQY